MKPPKELPSTLVALGEAWARRYGLEPGEFWAYVYRKAPPPPEVRAAIVDAFFPLVRPADFLGLTSEGEPSTLDTVNTSAVSSNALRSRARLSEASLKTKAVRVLARNGVTIAEVARSLTDRLGRKVPRSTVQAWLKPKEDPTYRAIPQDAADAFLELYGVPLASWPRIIPAP
jgi:hypothetical protein